MSVLLTMVAVNRFAITLWDLFSVAAIEDTGWILTEWIALVEPQFESMYVIMHKGILLFSQISMSVLVVFTDVLKHVPILMDHTHVDVELATHWIVMD